MQKNILTIATGKNVYLDLAINLALSHNHWHQNEDILFYIATDSPENIPQQVRDKIAVIPIDPSEIGDGFSSKLYLDKIAPDGATLFIDSDCLIFGNLSEVFEKFKGHQVSVIGNYISSGEWFGKIEQILNRFELKQMPKFNGGIYYLEKGEKASQVFQRARELEPQYDQIGFTRLRGKPNDEVLMALAMQLEGATPIVDDGTILGDPQACPGAYKIDVLSGKRSLMNPAYPHPKHQKWYPFEEVHPLVVHFLGYYTEHYPYQREVFLLKKSLNKKLSSLDRLNGILKIELPARTKIIFKNLFRPIFRKMFGTRQVKTSERL